MGAYAFIPQATAFPSSTGPANYAENVFSTESLTLLSPNPPLGSVASYIDSKGRLLLFKLVQLNCTVFPTLVIGPVFYKDDTQQVVTAVESEAVAGENSYAGILLNTGAANQQLVWIQVGGFLGADSDSGFGSGIKAPASGVTKGDMIVAAAGNQVVADVAAGTAPGYRPIAVVLTTAASGVAFDSVILTNYA